MFDRLARSTMVVVLMAGAMSAVAQDRVLAVLGGAQAGAADGGAVAEVDVTTGALTILGTPSPGDGLTGIAQLPDGRVFVVTNNAGSSGEPRLIQINPLDASVIQVVGTVNVSGSPTAVNDLAADPITGRLYGSGVSPRNQLLLIDPATGNATVVGSIEFPTVDGLVSIAFTPSGEFWGMEANGEGEIWQIDPADGSIISGPTATTPGNVGTIALGSLSDGRMLVAECCNITTGEDLWILDLASATSTFVGSMGANHRVHDFSVIGAPPPASVPALSFWSMAVLALTLATLGIAAYMRRTVMR